MGDHLRKFYKEKRVVIKGLATILEMDHGEGLLRREFEHILQILQKKTYNRTNEEIDLLMRATSQFEIFRKYQTEDPHSEDNIHNKCARQLQYKLIPKGSVLCRRGEYAKSMFFLIRGKINVYAELKPPADMSKPFVPSDIINSKPPSPTKSPDKRGPTMADLDKRKNFLKRGPSLNDLNHVHLGRQGSIDDLASLLEDNFHFEQKYVNQEVKIAKEKMQDMLLFDEECERAIDTGVYHDFWVQMECVLRYIGSIYPGKSFGDKEMTNMKAYEVTLIAAEDLHLGILHKKEFDNILIKAQKQKLAKKIDFFSTCLGFKASWKLVSEMSFWLQKGKKFSHQVIYNENDRTNGIFFIRKGNITLYKNPPPSQKKKEKSELDDLIQQKLKPDRPFPIQTLKKFDVFGEEYFVEKPNRLYSATVSSEVVKYYFLPQEKLPYLLEKYPDIKRELLSQARHRYIFREERFSKNGEIYTKILESSPTTRRNDVAPVRRTSYAIEEAYELISYKEKQLQEAFKSAPSSPSRNKDVNPYFPGLDPFSSDTKNRVEEVVDFNKKFLAKKKAEYSVDNGGEFIDIRKGNILGEKSVYFYKDRDNHYVQKFPSMNRSSSLPRMGGRNSSRDPLNTSEKVRKMLNITMQNSEASLRKNVLGIESHISKMEYPQPETEEEIKNKMSISDKAFQTAKLHTFAGVRKDFNIMIRGLASNKPVTSFDAFKNNSNSQSLPSSPRDSTFQTYQHLNFLSSNREIKSNQNSIIKEDDSKEEITQPNSESPKNLKTIISQLPNITEKEERFETKYSGDYVLQPAQSKKKMEHHHPHIQDNHVYLIGKDIQVPDFLPDPVSFKHKHSDQRPDGPSIMKLREKLLDPLYKLRKFIVPPVMLTSKANTSREHNGSWVDKGSDTNISIPSMNQTLRDAPDKTLNSTKENPNDSALELISAPMTLQSNFGKKKNISRSSSTMGLTSQNSTNQNTINQNTSRGNNTSNNNISNQIMTTQNMTINNITTQNLTTQQNVETAM